jgi:hypothetical protein
MDSKKIGLIVASAMPPPGKLKRRTGGSDEMESDDDMAGDGDEESRGAMALGDVWEMLKQGDKQGAYDAFCDLMAIHRSESPSKGEGEERSSYED